MKRITLQYHCTTGVWSFYNFYDNWLTTKVNHMTPSDLGYNGDDKETATGCMDKLLRKWMAEEGAVFVVVQERHYLDFDRDEDAAAFMLRWS